MLHPSKVGKSGWLCEFILPKFTDKAARSKEDEEGKNLRQWGEMKEDEVGGNRRCEKGVPLNLHTHQIPLVIH